MKSLVQYSISFIKVFNVCAPRGVLSRAGALERSAKFPTPEACSTERALASACQNLCYGYREFRLRLRALALLNMPLYHFSERLQAPPLLNMPLASFVNINNVK